ncbi:TIM barrel protein [Streptosporangiaceae bacterium NEAU-GS5]|nr:TIM barrel protein [Streptosporangiaceae bacterium NEAU-GS5]
MLLDRIAAAPISWGICDVPGWGHQLPARTVAQEMAGLGLAAAEFGPPGFLTADVLGAYGIRPLGGYVPLDAGGADPVGEARRIAAEFLAQGAPYFVLAPEGVPGDLKGLLDEVNAAVAGLGGICCLHPHVDTLIESAAQIAWALAETSVPLCLDTGHAHIGGADPVELARSGRAVHVHLKDVSGEWLARLRGGTPYEEAVAGGLYVPLGQGVVDIAGVVRILEEAGYQGWYVLEQDVRLTGPSARPREDAEASLNFLRLIVRTKH